MNYRIYVHEFVDGTITGRHLVLSGYHYQAHAETMDDALEKFRRIIKNAPSDTSHMSLEFIDLGRRRIKKEKTIIGYYGDYPVIATRM